MQRHNPSAGLPVCDDASKNEGLDDHSDIYIHTV